MLGEDADPLFKYLSENTKFNGFGKGPKAMMMGAIVKKMDSDYKNNGNIKWNFTKVLVDKNGDIVERFEPTADVKKIAEKVKEIL